MHLSCIDQRSSPEDKSIFHALMKRRERREKKHVSGMSFSRLAKLTLWIMVVFCAKSGLLHAQTAAAEAL